jgi:hypothetical protein
MGFYRNPHSEHEGHEGKTKRSQKEYVCESCWPELIPRDLMFILSAPSCSPLPDLSSVGNPIKRSSGLFCGIGPVPSKVDEGLP